MTEPDSIPWYKRRRGPGLIATAPVLVAYIISNELLHSYNRGTIPKFTRIGIALLPLPFFAWFIWRFVNLMRSSDEMQRRIQLEALAIAFPASVALLMTLGLMQIGSPPLVDYNHLWVGILVLYGIGRTIAERRYR